MISHRVPVEDIVGYNTHLEVFRGKDLPINCVYVKQSLYDILVDMDLPKIITVTNTSGTKVSELEIRSEEEFDTFDEYTRQFLERGYQKKSFLLKIPEENTSARLFFKMSW